MFLSPCICCGYSFERRQTSHNGFVIDVIRNSWHDDHLQKHDPLVYMCGLIAELMSVVYSSICFVCVSSFAQYWLVMF
jgi:hypothetical protein